MQVRPLSRAASYRPPANARSHIHRAALAPFNSL